MPGVICFPAEDVDIGVKDEERAITYLTESGISTIRFSFSSSSPLRALCPHVQGEGDAAQVAVRGRVVDDALPVQLALDLEVSVVLHPCETHRHHRRGVVDLRQTCGDELGVSSGPQTHRLRCVYRGGHSRVGASRSMDNT